LVGFETVLWAKQEYAVGLVQSERLRGAWGCGPTPCRFISTKGKGGSGKADRSVIPMRLRNLCCYVIAAFALLNLNGTALAQSLPSYVVDAQIPIVSTDGFNNPQGLAVGSDGSIYVADNGNHRVLKIARDGSQTVVSFGSLRPAVSMPGGVAMDGFGDLYVTDIATNRLIKLAPGAVNGLAIIGAPSLSEPTSVAADAVGNLAIVNEGSATVIIRRYGGTPVPLNSGSTVLVKPTAVAFDNQGLLYVADAGNGSGPGKLYRFAKTGGTGVSVGPSGYPLKDVTALLLDGQKNLFVLDAGSEQLIDVPASGAMPFLIPQSNFKSPSGLGVDSLGNFYVSDGGANAVTKLVYQNAANFGSVQVGATSKTILFNYEFYIPTAVEATRGIGGGVWNEEYKKASGGTCMQRTYYPSPSGTGLTLPAACTAALSFTPTYPGGRPGAVELQTSNGSETQLTIGTGLGAQLALLNAATTRKLSSDNSIQKPVVNAAATEIYFSADGGTYQMPVSGGTPTLVTTTTGLFAVNGAGDLFFFDGSNITKLPAGGSGASVIHVAGLFSPQGIAMDSNGAFYISDLGPGNPNSDNFTAAGFVMRVSSQGVSNVILPTGYVFGPTSIVADETGNIYVEDDTQQQIFKLAAWTGNYVPVGGATPDIGGYEGVDFNSFAVDGSGTVYYWTDGDYLFGLAYTAPSGQQGPAGGDFFADASLLPYYTVPEFLSDPGPDPYYVNPGTGANITTSVSGKMYITNASVPGLFLIDRTLGTIPQQSFGPDSYPSNPSVVVYNIGNQNATFTDASRVLTESGNGVGSFTFSDVTCTPGTVLIPGNYCLIGVTNTNAYGTGPVVTDTLHFLTNAVNNNSVSFKINGFGGTAP
jgi:NHL repeat